MNQAEDGKRISVLLVCLGNICRSPAAEAVLRKKAADRGLQRMIELDSAGTGNYHIGEAPDPRAIRAGRARGYQLEDLRARQVAQRDFESFDYILAMDESNLRSLQADCPAHLCQKISLLLQYSDSGLQSVPDPYWGTEKDFARLIELLEPACEGFLRHILATAGDGPGPASK